MRVIMAGGGTGGHLYPALAIAHGIKQQNPKAEILFVGTSRGLEAQVVPREGFSFIPITVQGLERRLSWRTVVTLAKILKALKQSWTILRRYSPDLVVGTGGYVCGPVLYMAHRLGIPTVIHEQNALPGLTNRWLSRYVDLVLITFEESRAYFPNARRIVTTGLPVRPAILTAERSRAAQRWRLDPAKTTLLAAGGSQGARSINRAMLAVLKGYRNHPGIQVIHITGPAGYDQMLKELSEAGLNLEKNGNIRVAPYVDDMENALAVADLIVCRAGASTLAEITARGIPAVLIPYPFAANNHQEFNARVLEQAGAAEVILDKELSGERLLTVLQGIIEDPRRLARMAAAAKAAGRPAALQLILSQLSGIRRIHRM